MSRDARKRDRHFALFTACLSLYLMATSFSYPADSSGFPRALSVALLILSLILLWGRRSEPRTSQEPTDVTPTADDAQRQHGGGLSLVWRSPALWAFAGTIIYITLIGVLGFFTATALYSLGMMLYLGQRRVLMLITWPVVFCAILYAVFRLLLGVPIPTGLLF